MSDLEGTVGYSLPKICVLFPMVVGSRRIADDTETDERYLIYITDLGDGSRFHIYCQPFVELFFNVVQFGTVGDGVSSDMAQSNNVALPSNRAGSPCICPYILPSPHHTS